MKNLSYILISFLILTFTSFQTITAQVSRNPEQGRQISRMPRPGNQGDILDRDRVNSSGKTKERNDTPQQTPPPVNHPINSEPVNSEPVEPYHPYRPPVCQQPEKPVIEQTTIIECNTQVMIIESPDKYIDDNPIKEIAEHEAAILRYNQALSMNPKDTLLYFFRGSSKLVTEDYFGAIEDFTIYLRLVPWDKEAYYKRGLAFLYYGDQKDALLDFKIASELGYNKGREIMSKYF